MFLFFFLCGLVLESCFGNQLSLLTGHNVLPSKSILLKCLSSISVLATREINKYE